MLFSAVFPDLPSGIHGLDSIFLRDAAVGIFGFSAPDFRIVLLKKYISKLYWKMRAFSIIRGKQSVIICQ
jgi:hypothetical protein